MTTFIVRDLASWEPVSHGADVVFPGTGEIQRLRFDIMSSRPVRAFLEDESSEEVLVAVGEGLLKVRCTVLGRTVLTVRGSAGPNAEVFVRRRTVPQLLDETDTPSFTTIEPRGVGPSADLRRMMLMVRLNADRREAALRAEIARLGGAFDALTRKPKPKAKPEAAPEAAPDAEPVLE
jgi:hypothetical protein